MHACLISFCLHLSYRISLCLLLSPSVFSRLLCVLLLLRWGVTGRPALPRSLPARHNRKWHVVWRVWTHGESKVDGWWQYRDTHTPVHVSVRIYWLTNCCDYGVFVALFTICYICNSFTFLSKWTNSVFMINGQKNPNDLEEFGPFSNHTEYPVNNIATS